MKWKSLQNKANGLSTYKLKNCDVEALLYDSEGNLVHIGLDLKFKANGDPYFVASR